MSCVGRWKCFCRGVGVCCVWGSCNCVCAQLLGGGEDLFERNSKK